MRISSTVIKRAFFDIVLLVAVFYTPWWIVAILAFVGAFIWSSYYEIFICGLLIDLLYGAPAFPLGGIYGLVGSVVIFFTALYARRIVR